MAPKVIDKAKKRKDMALACSNLIHDVGIKNLTIQKVADSAGIGKGTVYEYFENKEDIIFEIINIHIENYQNQFLKDITTFSSIKEKIFYFFNFVLNDDEETSKHFNGYREYLSIIFTDGNEGMWDFNEECNIFIEEQLNQIIQEGIDKNELNPISKKFIKPIMIFEKGLVLVKMTQKNQNVKKECENFINELFALISTKEGIKNV
ncbi:MAG: TetR family transcriptional regulator [uncultured Campylobacterales bacterium]|uniref:TetR family transcriptional regulator n=1 Tax=uncultured Campylobacterales bacterium TaxID=352960 RepID=A0A6S6SF81_9BACT|nr:MAG: TetR family transcriptional regulator [uncultured Campylobacterales bacterium]